LQRARATLDARLPGRDAERAPVPRSARERELVGQFVDAFESADIDRVVALLTEDAWLTMPPEPLEYQGHPAIAGFLRTRSMWAAQVSRLVPSYANNQPALGYYRAAPDGGDAAVAHGHGIVVLTLAGDKI